MFTLGTLVITGLISWWTERKNEQDRTIYDQSSRADGDWLLRLHTRQDLKLIAHLLAGVLIMLGVIADRIR